MPERVPSRLPPLLLGKNIEWQKKLNNNRKTPFSLPDVQQFQGIEQDPPLHVIINLLICPKTRSSIDLEINTRVHFCGYSISFFPTFPGNSSKHCSEVETYRVLGIELNFDLVSEYILSSLGQLSFDS